MPDPARRPRRNPVPIPENATGHDLNRVPMVREGLRVLDPKSTTFDEMEDRFEKRRIPYAPMHAHMEMAALALASGATFKLAAAKAGVSIRQIKKYYSQRDFRQRVTELREVMLGKVRGRLIREFERRTTREALNNTELLDFLRMWDRAYGPLGGKGAVNIQGDINVNNNYDTLIAALLADDGSEASSDFPIIESTSVRLSGGDSPE